MAFIEVIDESDADGRAAELIEADRAALGYVPNYSRAFAHRPEVYDGWRQLNGAIRETMELRRYELVTLAAARRLKSSYCALAHGKVLAESFFAPEDVAVVARDADAAKLDEVDRTVMRFAEKIVEDASAITRADVDELRTLGLSDGEIFEVAAAAAARCFFSKTLDALGVEPDSVFQALDPELRDALTVGRAIASS